MSGWEVIGSYDDDYLREPEPREERDFGDEADEKYEEQRDYENFEKDVCNQDK